MLKNQSQVVENEMVPITRRESEKPEPKPENVIEERIVEQIILITDTNSLESWSPDLEYSETEIINFSAHNFAVDTAEIIVDFVDKNPEPLGGVSGLRAYISRNIKYPVPAQENGIQGTVYLRFEVKKDGSIGIVQVLKSVDKLLDDEAVRVLKTLPKFKPGMINGKPVNVWFSIPVVFKLS